MISENLAYHITQVSPSEREPCFPHTMYIQMPYSYLYTMNLTHLNFISYSFCSRFQLISYSLLMKTNHFVIYQQMTLILRSLVYSS